MAEPMQKTRTSLDDTFQVCTFQVANRCCGVRIDDVKEINTATNFTNIYHTGDDVLGYLNIRGQIYLIMDIRKILGFKPGNITEKSRVILFKGAVGENFGILVDEVRDIVSISYEDIEGQDQTSLVNESGSNANQLILAECKVDDELLVILQPGAIFESFGGNRKAS